MEIYIEDAILQNFIINYVLLSISCCMCMQRSSKLRKTITSFFGCTFAIILTFFQFSSVIDIVIKILCGALMCAFAISKFEYKKYLLFTFTFLSFTFLMGGMIIAFEYLFNIEINGLICAMIIFVFYLILKSLIKFFYYKRQINHFYYKLSLENQGKNFKITAYLDSGNLIRDDETGLPILIINFETFEKIFNKVTIMDYLQKRLDKKLNGRYISVSTINGNGQIFVCSIDKIVAIENNHSKQIHVLLGLSNNMFRDKDYDALLSPLAL